MFPRFFFTVSAVCFSVSLALAQTVPVVPVSKPNPTPITLTSLEDTDGAKAEEIPFTALKTFVDVFDAIKQNYVEPVNNNLLIENAIRGMLTRLDPHSSYMNEKEYEDFSQQSEGDYAGIGVVLDMKAGSVSVVSAIPGSPAAKADIKSGDIISQIDGQSVSEMSLAEINKLFDGDEGTSISLTIHRGETVLQPTLVREVIHTNSVSSQMLTPGLAYIRITQFQEDTADSLEKEIASLNVKFTIDGLILDLRNNPGGLLESAVDTTDFLLDKGEIVSVRGRDAVNQEVFNATPGDLLEGHPIVVLINEGSASGAEIMAGALQDNKRAIIVGEKSFGKGSVQTITPLYHGGAVKLTTARYYTPSGKSIQATGITPEIQIKPLTVSDPKALPSTTEVNLPNHLSNATSTPDSNNSNSGSLAENDFQLYGALNILTAMTLQEAQRAALPTPIQQAVANSAEAASERDAQIYAPTPPDTASVEENENAP